jgi:hypothetical protein
MSTDDGAPAADGSSQRGVRAALAGISGSGPKPSFWDELESALDEQDQLDIVARPAVRSITEPPPLSHPRLEEDPASAIAAPARLTPLRRRNPSDRQPVDEDVARRRRLMGMAAVVVLLAVLVGASILGGDDGGVPSGLSTSTTATVDAPAEDAPSADPASVPDLEPGTPLTALGLGRLQVGLELGALYDLGTTATLDQSTYDGSGGTCFDVRLPAEPDLTLRFRSPDPRVGVDDPRDGVLVAVHIEAGIGSARMTEAGIGLGATEEQLGAAHAGDIEVQEHPTIPGGRVYLVQASDGTLTGMAYVTDGQTVQEISVGLVEVIRLRQACV